MSFALACIFYTFLLMLGLLGLNLALEESSNASSLREEGTSFECGFEGVSLSRVPFSVRYFLLTVVFLVFDLEIVMLVFSSYTIVYSPAVGVSVLVLVRFVSLLFFGLLYEWVDGALEWVL